VDNSLMLRFVTDTGKNSWMKAVKHLLEKHQPVEADLFSEFQNVVQSANHKLLNELQLEDNSEVLENIRYETARTSWLDRMPPTGSKITIATIHPECELVSGNFLVGNAGVIALTTDIHTFIVFNSYIIWITGWATKAHTQPGKRLDPFASQFLLQDLVDQQNSDTWYLNGGKALRGKLVRIFNDSLELLADTQSVTLKIDQVVAVRSVN
jgi:hypothetical protein